MNMNKYERLNQQKKYSSEKSFSGKKRVAAYCRVSTEKEEQAQSFESQCDFFRCYIEQKKEWEFYKVFADEGISGTSTKKREQFNRMIAEAKQRKFDLLITKEISRFARNTLDSTLTLSPSRPHPAARGRNSPRTGSFEKKEKPMKICAATGNAGKLRELRRILEAQGHEVVSQKELGITIEPDETGTTFAENALIKAETICKASGLPTIADDSGLCVDALGGAPGVYSARYCGHHGDDEANNDKLLDAMKEVPEGKRGAKFVSAVCFILPDGRHLTCMGECPGSIAFERLNGDYGFGYDPLFIPADCGVGKRDKRPNTEHRSYAQLTPDEKDAISHRGNALAVLEKQLPEFLGAAKEEGIIAQVSGTVEIELK